MVSDFSGSVRCFGSLFLSDALGCFWILSDLTDFLRVSQILSKSLRSFLDSPVFFPSDFLKKRLSFGFSEILSGFCESSPIFSWFCLILSNFFWILLISLGFFGIFSELFQILSDCFGFLYFLVLFRILPDSCGSSPIFFYFSRIPNASGLSWIFLISTRFFKSLFFSDSFRIVANCLEIFSNALGFSLILIGFSKIFLDSFESC